MKHKRFGLVLFITVILAIICSFLFKDMNCKFTTERWLNYQNFRYKMIDDIERNHSLMGKTQQEIELVLGETDSIWKIDSKDDCAYVYCIGNFDILHEPHIYVVSFQNGIVIATSVQST